MTCGEKSQTYNISLTSLFLAISMELYDYVAWAYELSPLDNDVKQSNIISV